MSKLESKILGTLTGLAIGEAVGEMAYRFPRPPHLLAEIEAKEVLRPGGDSILSLETANSILKLGNVNPQDLGHRFKKQYGKQAKRCFGPSLPKIIATVEKHNITYAEAAQRLFEGRGSKGNAAAVRVPAIGLLFRDDKKLYERAASCASVTHIHPIGTDGAAIMAKAIAELSKIKEVLCIQTFCKDLIGFASTRIFYQKLKNVRTLLDENTLPVKAAHHLGRSVTAHESLPFALYCFLLSSNDFLETMLHAVSNGGDSSTLGAMAGALSGAHLGIDGIPKSWISKLENFDQINQVAHKILDFLEQDEPLNRSAALERQYQSL